jgi:hypothetical protein
MSHRLRVVFFTACATVVSVAIWVVAVVLNLLAWLYGEPGISRPLVWGIVVVSAVAFWLVFYRHFNRSVGRR